MPFTEDDRYSDGSTEPCILCGARPARSNEFMSVMSFLIFTRHGRYEALLCRACTTRRGLIELAKSSILGWWGIPWGLMTFQAIWINTRSLIRWSNLGAPIAVVVGLLGLSLPAIAVYVAVQATQQEQHARSTGDWVDDETIALVDRGHEALERGDPEQALEIYMQAQRRAPSSSVINSAVASTLYNLGRYEEALPYAGRAESSNSSALYIRALRGLLFARTGDMDAAMERARALVDETPTDDEDAFWMAELWYLLEDDEQLERVARRGLELQPGDEYYLAARFHALLALDRIDEAGELVASIDEERPGARYLLQLYGMRTAPEEEIDRVLAGWAEGEYSPDYLGMLAEAARRSGRGEVVRARVERWLAEETTPSTAWFGARPWFDESRWVPALDHALARRPAVALALIRVQEISLVNEPDAVIEVVSRARDDDDPMMPMLDASYYAARSRVETFDVALAELETHARRRPDHVLCVIRLARLLGDRDPDLGRQWLDRAEEQAADDAGLEAEIELTRLELSLAEARGPEVLAKLTEGSLRSASPYRSTTQDDLFLAEAAFHAGDDELMNRTIDRVIASDDAASHAAVLLIRWSAQWASGRIPTYGTDTAVWFERAETELHEVPSRTAQSMLLAEGRTDAERFRRATGREPGDTAALVVAMKHAAETAGLSDDALAVVAGSEDEGGFAPRIARTILASRRTAR